MQADYHVHTEFSDDSEYPMENVVQDAISLGLDEICFTDHVDYGVKVDWDSGKNVPYRLNVPLLNVDYPRYRAEIERLKSIYKNQIQLKTGLEFGIQVHTIDAFEKLFARYPWDFIILSIHQVDDQEFWTQDFQKGKTQKEYNERYYEELFEVIQRYKNYSVLGHLDLVSRYDQNGIYPFENLKPLITQILKTVIEDGKGLELNTSYHRYGLGDVTPSLEILKLYKDLGGTIITIGSDSHKPDHLGTYLEEAKVILRTLGFEAFYTFEKMQPIAHPL